MIWLQESQQRMLTGKMGVPLWTEGRKREIPVLYITRFYGSLASQQGCRQGYILGVLLMSSYQLLISLLDVWPLLSGNLFLQ